MLPAAGLDIVTSNPRLSFGINQPSAVVDGRPLRLRWGANPIPLPPGRHQVQVCTTAPLASHGHAGLVVDVAPGQWIRVYYSAPLSITAPGSMGFAPVSPNGRTALILLRVLPAAFMVVVLVGIMMVMALMMMRNV
jgi:hypothetical protein